MLNHYAVKGGYENTIPWQETLQGLPILFFFDSYIHLVLVNIICDNFVLAFNSTMLLQGKDKFSNDHRIQQAIKKQKRKSCQMCDLKSFCLSKMVVDERFLYLLSKASLRRLETVLIKVRHRTLEYIWTSGGFDCANFRNNVTEKCYFMESKVQERGEREREREIVKEELKWLM